MSRHPTAALLDDPRAHVPGGRAAHGERPPGTGPFAERGAGRTVLRAAGGPVSSTTAPSGG